MRSPARARRWRAHQPDGRAARHKELRKRWAKLSPSIRSQIIDEIAVVTVQPARRGVRGFDPTAIDVVWK